MESSLFVDFQESRPLIVPGYPRNTTVELGGQARLLCKVHKPAFTKVQWLKSESSSTGASQPQIKALTVRSGLHTTKKKQIYNFSVADLMFSSYSPCRAAPPKPKLFTCPMSRWKMQANTSAWLRAAMPGRLSRPCSRRGCRSCLVSHFDHLKL